MVSLTVYIGRKSFKSQLNQIENESDKDIFQIYLFIYLFICKNLDTNERLGSFLIIFFWTLNSFLQLFLFLGTTELILSYVCMPNPSLDLILGSGSFKRTASCFLASQSLRHLFTGVTCYKIDFYLKRTFYRFYTEVPRNRFQLRNTVCLKHF